MHDESPDTPPQSSDINDLDHLTVDQLREMLDELPGDAPVLISELDDRSMEYVRNLVVGAEVRQGFNVAPALVLTSCHPEHALT